jgi:acetyl esterase/lipase
MDPAHSRSEYGPTRRIVLLGPRPADNSRCSPRTDQRAGVRGVISLYGPIDLARRTQSAEAGSVEHSAYRGRLLGSPPEKFAKSTPTLRADVVRDHRPRPLAAADAADLARATASSGKVRACSPKLNESGTSAAYLEIPWAEHAFDEVFSGVSSQLSLYYTERFLAWAMR